MTTISTWSRTTLAALDEVVEAAGAGDEDVDALAQRLDLEAVAGAAVDGGDPQLADAAEPLELAGTWAASSRVGTSTSARGRLDVARSTRSTIGMPKARVLPEPVGARPQTSRPARPSAMVSSWIGKGASMPRLEGSRRGRRERRARRTRMTCGEVLRVGCPPHRRGVGRCRLG